MNKHSININVLLDNEKMPEHIDWSASGNNSDAATPAKGVLLSLWDGSEKTALRIDLWTKDMMIDEMTDFFYQTMMTMADTFGRATNHDEIAGDMKNFAQDFYRKSRDKQLKENKA